ncbi:MAG TPA: SCO family protein, partial [Candidatus Udaeobacter sp.]|nr:SCO family protein [Candidatus Udaeobacter sp.]
MASAGAAVVAVLALWMVPRLVPQTGTLVVVASGKAATALPSAAFAIRSGATWTAVGSVAGEVPAAPSARSVLSASLAAGTYDAIRVGGLTYPVSVTVTANQVEPVLIGLEGGHVLTGAVYAGNDEVNLGLGELAGKFVPMPAFELSDQRGAPVDNSTLTGKDVIVAAFHTTCHETCPLYTALFLQLSKRIPASSMLLEVTTDPTVDDPSMLTAYAKQVGARWTFGTGSAGQVADFWRPFGVELASGDSHTSTLALIDR